MQIAGIAQNSSKPQQVKATKSEMEDSLIKSYQQRIEELQQRIQDLAEADMDPKLKQEKKKEMLQQIADLKSQTMQRQAELRQKKQDEAAQKQAERQAEKEAEREAKKQDSYVSASAFTKQGFHSMLSADNSVKLSRVHGNTAAALEGRAKELKSEIKLDGGRGAASENKIETAAKLTVRAQKAKKEQLSDLGDANRDTEAAAKAEKKDNEKKLYGAENNEEKEDKLRRRIPQEGIYDKDGSCKELEEQDKEGFEDKA
ncbi:MAG: hypothetical protein NC203_07520 [Firmicutes bacterium]|nr:hypothetical protein [[Eubacterium] siraeum]MCM1488198.1 hypothetical protein [Bacillota bacterium]